MNVDAGKQGREEARSLISSLQVGIMLNAPSVVLVVYDLLVK